MKSLANRLKGNRRVYIIAGAFVMVLVLGGYIFWANATWTDYHASYAERKGETKASIDSALKMPSNSSKERVAKLKALTSASEDITAQDTLCHINSMVGWQQAINGSYKKWQQECESTQASIDSLNGEIGKVADYTKNDQELAGVISTALAATDKKVTESSFSSVLAKWKAAVASVKTMHVSEEFAPVKAQAQKAISDVAAAWQAITAAHTAKDEAKYEVALTTLAGAYSALDGVKQESTKQVTELGKTVQSRYDTAF